MNKTMLAFLAILGITTAPICAETSSTYEEPKSQSFALIATQTVLEGCQTLAQLVMVSGAWKMINADDCITMKILGTDLDKVIFTKHTYPGQMFEGAAAIVVGYLIYKGSCLFEQKIVPQQSCCYHCDATCEEQNEAAHAA